MAAVLSTNMTLSRVIATLRDLPPAPAVAARVMRLTSSLDSKVEAISQLLSSDQALAARVLRMSNSPSYGRSREVQSVGEGVMVLGFETIRTVIVAAAMHSMFAGKPGSEMHSRLWEHSLATAVAARELGSRLNRSDSGELYLAGLLHDVGKLVILSRMPRDFHKIVQGVKNEEKSFCQMEQSTLDFTHCDVASLLLTKWVFPLPLAQAVSEHHRHFDPSSHKSPPMAFVVQVANLLSKSLEVGFVESAAEWEAKLPEKLSLLRLRNDQDDITQKVRELYEHERALFDE